jgi:hypothetical protein
MSDALRCAAQPLLPEQPRTPRIAMIDNEERKLKVLVQYIVFFLTSILLQAAFLPPLAPFDVGQRITLTFTCSFTAKRAEYMRDRGEIFVLLLPQLIGGHTTPISPSSS